MRHGYTNSTFGDGALVVKCFEGPDAARRLRAESRHLRRMRGKLPVPRLQQVSATSVTTRFVEGAHGQDLMEDGHARQVLAECGRLLSRVHALGVVHGDFGPHNLLLDPATFEAVALLDWEWAHTGDPVEDLAWCEWIVREHHSAHVAALDHFFTAYGSAVPSWEARHAAMLARCRELLDFSARWEPGGDGEKLWLARVETTAAWSS
ncbi:phosphotransferase [Nonomuraea sp. NBC_01738]|uniref:phosphotransferase n=1 Tax=Nonomuraea sp. NBC_01738 TaxID=2976003 RepID=UPI002E0F15C4|nr:phosphotransferase [Nonomuraea sp. NBC_01738]